MSLLARTRWAVAALGAAVVAFAFASPALAQRHGGHGGHHGGHGGHHGGHSSFGIHIGGGGGHYGGHHGGHYGHHYDWPYVVGGIIGGTIESRDRYYYDEPNYYYEDRVYVRRAPAPPRYSGAPITISNPKGSGSDLTYRLNQWTYTIKPGESQKIKHDREWIIRFDRGDKQGSAEYSLKGGLYSVKRTAGGWELFNTTEKKDAPPSIPAPPEPPKAP
jgi:hypothetical protein